MMKTKKVIVSGVGLLAAFLNTFAFASDLLVAERFVDSFYSYDQNRLAEIMDAEEEGERVLYYQAWADAANYEIQKRRPCTSKEAALVCQITVENSSSKEEGAFSVAYRYYALGLLVVVYVFNFIDRSILGILVEPIKRDLGVNDTMMGFLGGIAFATFYTFLGIPIARLSDMGSRRSVLTVCLALWSGATALCGLAANFFHLLLARIGVTVPGCGSNVAGRPGRL